MHHISFTLHTSYPHVSIEDFTCRIEASMRSWQLIGITSLANLVVIGCEFTLKVVHPPCGAQHAGCCVVFLCCCWCMECCTTKVRMKIDVPVFPQLSPLRSPNVDAVQHVAVHFEEGRCSTFEGEQPLLACCQNSLDRPKKISSAQRNPLACAIRFWL